MQHDFPLRAFLHREENTMVELVEVTAKEKDVLNNLLEKYLYEFSSGRKQTLLTMGCIIMNGSITI